MSTQIQPLMQKVFLSLFLLGATLLSISLFQGALELLAVNDRVAIAEAEKDAIQSENQDLQAQLTYRDSIDFQEQEIRENLYMAKPDEVVVVVPQTNDDKNTQREESEQMTRSLNETSLQPKWRRWIEIFSM